MAKIKINPLYIILAIVLLIFLWRIDSLGEKYNTEKSEHAITRAEKIAAIKDAQGWKLSYEKTLESALSHSKATKACLDREALAQSAQKERNEIMQNAQVKKRTEEEKQEVVDDATRMRVIDRLNHPL